MIGVALSTRLERLAASLHQISPSKLANTVSTSRSGTLSLIPNYMGQFPFGAGLGSSGPAYGNQGSSANTIDGESQITFLIGEVGVPGLVLFIAFQARVLGSAVRRLRRVADSETRILLAGLIAPLFALVANWYSGINTTSTAERTVHVGSDRRARVLAAGSARVGRRSIERERERLMRVAVVAARSTSMADGIRDYSNRLVASLDEQPGIRAELFHRAQSAFATRLTPASCGRLDRPRTP